jgi:UDP-galactopyranose mutase
MFTFEDVFGSRTANEARIAVERDIVPQETTDTVESWCLANIGKTLYELLVKGYTEKQWGRKASQLPASYIKRLPMRFEYDNRYFSDRYQGIPFDGYTQMVSKMLDGIEVRCNVDFFTHRHLEQQATKVFYTGPIDRLVEGEPLAYRAISIELVELPTTSALGCAQVNYPGNESWTRITEFKHFMTQTSVIPYTIIGIERPEEYNGTNERSYPVTDTENSERAARYIAQAEAQGYLVAGRLGSFQYLDMHQAIAQGITRAEKELYAAQ